MKRRSVVRQITLGALITGLGPLTSAGVGAAASGDSPAALCQSSFGDQGPGGGPVVGEGPSGDPMGFTIGWEPSDWSDGLREVVTCVSVDGRAASGLTTSMATPFNSGILTLNLTLPAGEPGALVCEQSILVGSGSADGRHKPTSPVCFKLRAAEPEPPARSEGRTSDGAPAPATPPATPAARAPRSSPPAPGGKAPAGPAPAKNAPVPDGVGVFSPYPGSTPPARAAFEAALGLTRPATRPLIPATETPRADPAAGATTNAPSATTAPRTTPFPRTGLDNHIPLAGGGALLALGGAAIVLGESRRRLRRPGALSAL